MYEASARASSAMQDEHWQKAATALDTAQAAATTDSLRVEALRMQATAWGHAGEYAKQRRALQRAAQIAVDAGLDSLRRRVALSIGNVEVYCSTRDINGCGGVSEDRWWTEAASGAIAGLAAALLWARLRLRRSQRRLAWWRARRSAQGSVKEGV